MQDLETITNLDNIRTRDGWHPIGRDQVALVVCNCRSFRTCEPRFNSNAYKLRSSYGFFPEFSHAHGMWWYLEQEAEYMSYSSDEKIRGSIGFPVPIMIFVFAKDTGSSSLQTNIPIKPNSRGVDEDPAAEPMEHGHDHEPPPMQPLAQPLGEDQVPEWSSWDLGVQLRALRSTQADGQVDLPRALRALKRLHMRWWHASATKMRQLLSHAGVQESILRLLPGLIDSCKICRLWRRPGNRAVTTSRITNRFNELVQADILFWKDHMILVLIDEATRWCTGRIIKSKDASTMTRCITEIWIRYFGAMQTLMSDHEGALTSDEGALWAEKWSINMRLTPKGSHAWLIERHHQALRDMLHKIESQALAESLGIDDDIIVAEGLHVKNIMTSVGGSSPHEALLGRAPRLLMDIEEGEQRSTKLACPQELAGTLHVSGRLQSRAWLKPQPRLAWPVQSILSLAQMVPACNWRWEMQSTSSDVQPTKTSVVGAVLASLSARVTCLRDTTMFVGKAVS